MVDIHSHILPGLDDGSRSLEESVAMIRMAAEGGTTDIVATPHASRQYSFDPTMVRQKAAELQAAAVDVRIYTGCDFHLSFDNIQDAIAHPRKYTINGKQYLLVEFPDMVTFNTTPRIFGELRRAGIVPIITHPERNAFLQEKTDEMAQWVEDGAYIQITGQSFLGMFGRRARDSALELMKRRLVHFIASDAHDLTHRTTRLRESFAFVADRYGNALAELVFRENPAAVITGEPLPEPEPPRPKPWYKFWS